MKKDKAIHKESEVTICKNCKIKQALFPYSYCKDCLTQIHTPYKGESDD